MNVQFVIFRTDNDERTVAIVTAEVESKLKRGVDFFKALKRAITTWVKETKEGKAAWELSSKDFNIGDFSFNMVYSTQLQENHPPKELWPYLQKEGIDRVDVEIFSDDSPCTGWDFDTVLVNEDELVEDEDEVKV